MTAPSSPSPAAAVLTGLDAVRGWAGEVYRDLHAHPELSHKEHATASQVAARLGDSGIEVHTGVGGTGVVGLIRNGKGPVVLLRADMDALPVAEATGLDYASHTTTADAAGNEVPVGMLDDGLATLLPEVDVALAQHVLPAPAGLVGTHAGPTLSAADSMRITLHGRGAHGSMPQASVDPVVLAAMIVVRLQTVVARETRPGEPVVLTVGSIQAGTKSNVIPDHAVIELNVRTYSERTRASVLDAIQRIVDAECQASGCPKPADYELFDRFPLTDNDAGTTEKVAAAFASHFGERATALPMQTASEDFSDIPRALGVPYCYWGIGGIDPATYQEAEQAGRIAQDIPVNHSAHFAPVIEPTLDTGIQAMVVAALAWLGSPAGEQ
ncbi:MAG: peptidase dimerization domain-containing protein [Mycobacteriales bacterium]